MVELKGNIVDVSENRIYPGKISAQKDRILVIKQINEISNNEK